MRVPERFVADADLDLPQEVHRADLPLDIRSIHPWIVAAREW